jgi:phospholipase A1/A2
MRGLRTSDCHSMPRICLLIVVFVALVAAAPQTRADVSTPDLQACAEIGSSEARLACYDRAVGREAAEASKTRAARASVDVFSNRSVSDANRCDKGPPSSLLDSRWELDVNSAEDPKPAPFCIRPYRPIYLLAYTTTNTNRLPSSPNPDNTVSEPESITRGELKYQISLKTKVANDLFGNNGDLWMGYTQASHWQIFNEDRSRPFRETNYEPDANLVFRTDFDVLGWKARMLSLGLVHQSNGRSNPLSRSWNRATAALGLERENWTITLRPWWRVLEFGEDNNPDISDYMGRGDVEIIRVVDDSQFALTLRHSLRGGDRGHGAVQFDWAFPIAAPLRGHVQIFNGYGESLIDYNHRAWYAGLGVSLIEWY